MKTQNSKPNAHKKAKKNRKHVTSHSSPTTTQVLQIEEKRTAHKRQACPTKEYSDSDISLAGTSKHYNSENKLLDSTESLISVKKSKEKRSENILKELAHKLMSYCWRSSSSTVLPEIMKPPDGSDFKDNATDAFNKLHDQHLEERVVKNINSMSGPSSYDKFTSQNEEILKKRDENFNQTIPAPNGLHCNINKAHDIVQTALDYGLAYGIVANKGKYFFLTKDGKLKGRSLTPGLALRASRKYFSDNYSSDESSEEIMSQRSFSGNVSLLCEVPIKKNFTIESTFVDTALPTEISEDVKICKNLNTSKTKVNAESLKFDSMRKNMKEKSENEKNIKFVKKTDSNTTLSSDEEPEVKKKRKRK